MRTPSRRAEGGRQEPSPSSAPAPLAEGHWTPRADVKTERGTFQNEYPLRVVEVIETEHRAEVFELSDG